MYTKRKCIEMTTIKLPKLLSAEISNMKIVPSESKASVIARSLKELRKGRVA